MRCDCMRRWFPSWSHQDRPGKWFTATPPFERSPPSFYWQKPIERGGVSFSWGPVPTKNILVHHEPFSIKYIINILYDRTPSADFSNKFNKKIKVMKKTKPTWCLGVISMSVIVKGLFFFFGGAGISLYSLAPETRRSPTPFLTILLAFANKMVKKGVGGVG